MLHFFRKIRHDLLANSKTYKYFKYAIGEIILVVLGILIALQINNWNEERKNSVLFDSILLEVEEELIKNIKLSRLIIDDFHDLDSVYYLILYDSLRTENYLRDTLRLLALNQPRQFVITDRAFTKLLELKTNRTPKQDSIQEMLIKFYAKDSLEISKRKTQKSLEAFDKLSDDESKYKWSLDMAKVWRWTPDHINYRLNNPEYKRNAAQYLRYTLSLGSIIQQWEKRFIKVYQVVHLYLENQNLTNGQHEIFEFDPTSFNHYLGTYKFIWTSHEALNLHPNMEASIRLNDGKYYYQSYILDSNSDTLSSELNPLRFSEILAVDRHYFRLIKHEYGAYYTFDYDRDGKVSSLEVSESGLKIKFKKIN